MSYGLAVSHKQDKGNLVSVYDSVAITKNIQARIKRHKDDGRYKKHVPLWESFIATLRGLK